ncbi:MAG TPA: MFS transporter [Chthoniobacterales bacterium]
MKSDNPEPSGSAHALQILFLTVFIDMVGFGIVVPVLPLYTERFGASPFTIGTLLAVYSGMGFLFSPLVGILSDRFGRKSILLLSTVGQAAGFFIMGAANTLVWLFIARTIDGIFGANVSATQAYVADVTPESGRSKGMGLLGAAFGLGFICGPLLGGVLSQMSLSTPFYFAGALAAANAVLIWLVLPESLSKATRIHRQGEPLLTVFQQGRGSTVGPLLTAYFFMMFGFALMTAFFAIFTEDRFGFGATQNGYVFAGIGVIAVIIQARLIGPLLSRFTEKRLALAGAAILACSLFALPLVQSIGALAVACGGIAAGNSLINPTVSGLASRSVNAFWQGRVMGLLQASASMGRCLGPIAGGWLLTLNSKHTPDFGKAPFWTGSALLIVSFLLMTGIPVRREPWIEEAAR